MNDRFPDVSITPATINPKIGDLVHFGYHGFDRTGKVEKIGNGVFTVKHASGEFKSYTIGKVSDFTILV